MTTFRDSDTTWLAWFQGAEAAYASKMRLSAPSRPWDVWEHSGRWRRSKGHPWFIESIFCRQRGLKLQIGSDWTTEIDMASFDRTGSLPLKLHFLLSMASVFPAEIDRTGAVWGVETTESYLSKDKKDATFWVHQDSRIFNHQSVRNARTSQDRCPMPL